ncbi:SDR family NAD(P)-dependent oxidoreductase [Mycobacterium senriense]|nr:SDR family oxidoreductase [Mycobacterium senriense]
MSKSTIDPRCPWNFHRRSDSRGNRAADVAAIRSTRCRRYQRGIRFSRTGPRRTDRCLPTNTLEVNLVGAFHLARLAAAPMIAAGEGSIINISSILGLVAAWPIPDAAYTSSKGALISLTRDLACQWARHGVRVNALAPGFFPSESSAPMTEDEASQRYLHTGCPMRRMGEPGELDGALLFLASRASTYMTGQVLTVDGGWTAH